MTDLEVLVESTLDSIHVSAQGRTVEIGLTCAWDKAQKKITAVGVEEFLADELRLSNIIQEVRCFDAVNIQANASEVADRVFFLMRGKSPAPADLVWKPLKAKLDLIGLGALRLLVIEPVYGATVLVLAQEIRVEDTLTDTTRGD
ncbi:hypothetical protein [Variovorax sp. KK3]|uniref:hypothetical protein n=1 Tax=Variovorax sp. KK3 TaxID=1855728 RepID=UPI00097BD2A3|nr:hypothetical protein [Variovorax sp. KK3]